MIKTVARPGREQLVRVSWKAGRICRSFTFKFNGGKAPILVTLNGRGGARKQSFVHANANDRNRPIAVIRRELTHYIFRTPLVVKALDVAP